MNNMLFSAIAVATLLVPFNRLDTPVTMEGRKTTTPAEAPMTGGLPTAPALALKPESKLWLEGTSTVRSYKCEAKEIVGAIRTTDDQPLPALEGLVAAVREAGITIPVAQLDCNNGTMNGHMLKALKSKEYETIAYRLDTFDLTTDGDEGEVELRGYLTLTGQELPITFTANIARTDEGTLRLEGQTELDMTEFGVNPPRLMLGTLKVHEQVRIHFDLLFGP